MRKDVILDYIKTKTSEAIEKGDLNSGADALEVALALKLDRANVSKELNKLWKEGILIKINVRPVLFLDLKTLQSAYPYSYIPSIIAKNEDLSNFINNKTTNTKPSPKKIELDNLDKMIGSDGSLKIQIEQAKAAISYPPSGLQTLIIGSPGSGKLMLASYMMDYAINHAQKPKNSKFIRLNCQNFRENTEAFLLSLVGSKNPQEEKGYFEKTNGGILYLDNIHLLSEDSLDIILGILERNQYSKIDDNRFIPLSCTIILSCNNHNYANLNMLKRVIPLTIDLPNIDDYLPYEKIELILETLAKEAKASNQTLRVHKDILALLANASYPQNLTELRNKIKLICSKAYLDTINRNINNINITYNHLPNEILEKKERLDITKTSFYRILSIIPNEYIFFNSDGYSETLERLKNAPEEFSIHRASQFLNELRSNIDEIENVDTYIKENISCMQYCGNAQIEAVKSSINPIVNQVVLKHLNNTSWFKPTENNSKLLYGIMLHVSDSLFRNRSDAIDQNKINNIKMHSETNEEYKISYNVLSELANIFKISFIEKEYDFFAMYLSILKQWFSDSLFLILFVSHGESIAKQYAEYAKSLNPHAYVDYIDISGNLQLNDVLELTCAKVSRYDNCSGIVILSDGVVSSSISDHILKETGIRSRVLYPISFNLISDTVNKCKNRLTSLDMFENRINYNRPIETSDESKELISPFIDRLAKNYIAKSVTFIDVDKAVTILHECLNKILADLKITYSDEIGVKYYCHCTHMLERVIAKETLVYEGMKSFINDNKNIFTIIENNMKLASQAYGIQIPLSELCFLTEMFQGF